MNEFRAYLYTINDDFTFNVHAGTMHTGYNRWSKSGRFTPDEGRWCFVSNEPGVLHYKRVWLIERDDERVKEIYLNYHKRRAEELERQLTMHKRAIDALEAKINGNLSL